MRKISFTILAFINLFIFIGQAQNGIEITFEDYNDQNYFNNFSGNWGELSIGSASTTFIFDTANHHGSKGACLKVNYSLPNKSLGGFWHSLLGNSDYNNQFLDFTDLYRDLKNSSNNPSDIQNVQVVAFSFWAKGNGIGSYNHTVKVEFKDVNLNVTSKTFNIPNTSNWTKYEFPLNQMYGVDFTRMKQVTFVLPSTYNNGRTSYFFLDDLTLETDEKLYNANNWIDDQFLDLIAQRSFNYFLVFTDNLGFSLDRSNFSDLVSVGAIGFQLTSYCIGYKNGWVDDVESRVESILQNLKNLPMGPEPGTVNAGYKGFFYHFLSSNTGLRKNNDVELSLYDTMLLMYGVLTCKECFPNNQNIQSLSQSLYDTVEWGWMVDPSNKQFYLEWSPENGFKGHADSYTDEALLVDVLALGSFTNPVTMDTYNARSRYFGSYPLNGTNNIATCWTGSLFNYFFASCWLYLKNRGIDYHAVHPLNIWENNKMAIIANRQFCINHHDNIPNNEDDNYTTYGPLCWGLTACDNLVDYSSEFSSEYYAFGALPTQQNIHNPKTNAPHLGTIAVYGAGSCIVYTPIFSTETIRYFFNIPNLWNPLFGFGDAFSKDPHYFEYDENCKPIVDSNGNLIIHPVICLNGNWINHMVMAIDDGPMLLAIENYRKSTVWNLTSKNPNICKGLDTIFGPVGDLNRDRKLDSMDEVILANYIAENTMENLKDSPYKSDINADGFINVLDLTILKNKLAGNQ